MIGAVFRGPGHLGVGEIETPEIGPDEVLVGANTVCGTGVRILHGEKMEGGSEEAVVDAARGAIEGGAGGLIFGRYVRQAEDPVKMPGSLRNTVHDAVLTRR